MSKLPGIDQAQDPAAAAHAPVQLWRRIALSVLIGAVALLVSLTYRSNDMGMGDIPVCHARALLQGEDPYACPHETVYRVWPTNPLTTIMLITPFASLSDEAAASAFMAIGTGVMVFGLLGRGYWPLLTLLSPAYWIAFRTAQWSPLLLGVALLPGLLPLALAKPQVGLPIILMNLTWRRAVACGVFVLASFALIPDWPWRWLPQTTTYDGFIPLLTLPGPLILIALLRWRQQSARWLLLLAAVPQRALHDQLLLWIIPRSPRESLLLTICAWLGAPFWYPNPPAALVVTLLYIPSLLIVAHQTGILRDLRLAVAERRWPTSSEGTRDQVE
jgi:hypothetical protein